MEIASARLSSSYSWNGDESQRLQSWIDQFKVLELHDELDVSAIGREGVRITLELKNEALKIEKNDEIFGR